MELSWKIKTFNEIGTEEIYQILALRSEIFVVEQTCVYQDVDQQDQQSIHVIGKDNDTIVAYARLVPGKNGKDTSIGRVIIRESHRGNKLGDRLVEKCLEASTIHYKGLPLEMSAQKRLVNYYGKHGFIKEGDPYLEDGIPHILMRKKPI